VTIRACGAVVAIAAMLIVPPLLLAHPAQNFGGPRLARGFEPPPSKVSVAQAVRGQMAAAALREPIRIQIIDADPADSLHRLSPRTRSHARRGPPASPLA